MFVPPLEKSHNSVRWCASLWRQDPTTAEAEECESLNLGGVEVLWCMERAGKRQEGGVLGRASSSWTVGKWTDSQRWGQEPALVPDPPTPFPGSTKQLPTASFCTTSSTDPSKPIGSISMLPKVRGNVSPHPGLAKQPQTCTGCSAAHQPACKWTKAYFKIKLQTFKSTLKQTCRLLLNSFKTTCFVDCVDCDLVKIFLA